MTYKKTERGFSVYGELEDTYGSSIKVVESSVAGDPCCWVFCDAFDHKSPGRKPSTPHLSVPEAKKLVQCLQNFINDSEDPKHWKNSESYIGEFRVDEDSTVE